MQPRQVERTGSRTAQDPRDDASLVAAVLQGDRAAGEALCLRYAPMVRRMVRHSFGPEIDVEDVTQDVFHNLYRDLDHLREPGALRSFVVSLTLNVVRYEIRRRTVRRLIGLTHSGDLPEVPPDDRTGLGPIVLRRLYRLLDRLSANDRTVLVLRHFEGFSLPEIVEATGLSLATVKRRLTRASAALMRGVRNDATMLEYLRGFSVMDHDADAP